MEPVPDWEDGLCTVLKTALGSFMNHSEQLFNMQILDRKNLEESPGTGPEDLHFK